MAENSTHTLPGNIITQGVRPSQTIPTGIIRLPAVVAKGPRLVRQVNAEIVRSTVPDEDLTFTGTGPYRAVLTYPSDGNTENMELIDSDGNPLNSAQFRIESSNDTAPATTNDTIVILSQFYDTTLTYSITYISSSRDVKDEFPALVILGTEYDGAEIRTISAVGLNNDALDFEEGVDFFIETAVTGPTADAGNTSLDAKLFGTTNGNFATASILGPSSTQGIVFTALTEGVEENDVSIIFTETGTEGATESIGSNTVTITYNAGVSTTTSIVSTIAGASLTQVSAAGTGTIPWYATGLDQTVFMSSLDQSVSDFTLPNATAATTDPGSGESLVLTAAASLPLGRGIEVILVTGSPESVVEDTGLATVTITYVTTTSTTTSINSIVTAALGSLTQISAVSGAGATPWTTGVMDGSSFTDAAKTGANVSFSTTADMTHAYTRSYELECTTGGDEDTAVFFWNSSPLSKGNSVAVRNPVHASLDTDATHGNTILLSAGKVDIELEYGVKVSFHNGRGSFVLGDTYIFNANAPGVIELDAKIGRTTQFASQTVDSSGVTGLGVLTVASDTSEYTGDADRTYSLLVTAAGAASTTFHWSAVGDDGFSTGTTNALSGDTEATLDEALRITTDLSGGAFIVGDEIVIDVVSGRVFMSIKDDREITMTVLTAGANAVVFDYTTNTQEGGTGTVQTSATVEYVEFNGNLKLWVRNDSVPMYTVGDIFVTSVDVDTMIDWSLQLETTESIDIDSIRYDRNGVITGTANTYYFETGVIPDSIQSLKNSSNADIAGTIVTDDDGLNTVYINLGSTDPADDLTIIYRSRGGEPDPGVSYRFTGSYLRPDALYNTPILITSEQDGNELVGPTSASNHAAIANKIAWEHKINGYYLVQVQDLNDDGFYEDEDYRNALVGTETDTTITDLAVLDSWDTNADQITHLNKMADPYTKTFRLGWFGAPINTPIGDVNTVGSLVYTANKTMAVSGEEQYHGTRILVAPTYVDIRITLDSKDTKKVRLNGSFLALDLCMWHAVKTREPWETPGNKTTSTFETIQTYSRGENTTLDEFGINWLTDLSGGLFQWGSGNTVDQHSDYTEINLLTQDMYARATVDATIETNVIFVVPESPKDGLIIVRGAVKGALAQAVSSGKIGQYTTDGIARKISDDDVVVARSETTATLYRYSFAYHRKRAILRTIGTAYVDVETLPASVTG